MNRLVLASLMLVMIALGAVAVGAPDRADDVRVSSISVAIEFDGMGPAFFSSVEGLSVEITVVEYREGGNNEFTRKLPGVRKYPNLILKRGFDGHPSALQQWGSTSPPARTSARTPSSPCTAPRASSFPRTGS